jgi:hypothetical protein
MPDQGPGGGPGSQAGPSPDAGEGGIPEHIARRLLELRENSGIRLDREGHFWHRGVLIEHAGVAAAFHRWLGRDERGRYVLRTDRDWCVVEVEDAPIVVRSVDLEPDGGAVTLHLSDGTLEPLRPGGLEQSAENVLYCQLERGWPARFSRTAYYQLAERLETDASGAPALRVSGALHPVNTASTSR